MKKIFQIQAIILGLLLLVNPLLARKMNILVYPFNNTGEKKFSWISAGMTDTAISDLNKIQDVSVISEKDRKKAIKEIQLGQTGIVDEETMVKVGKITGANIIFSGSYLVLGKRIRVNAKLIRVDTGKVTKSLKIDGTLKGLFDLQDKIIFKLMAESQKIQMANIKPITFTQNEKKKIKKKYRPKPDAYKWYAKGLEIHFTNPYKALKYYKKALRIDNKYYNVMFVLGFLYNNLNKFKKALHYYRKCESILKRKDETNTEGYALLMNYIGEVYHVKGQLDRALEYYRKAKKIRDNLGLQNTRDYANVMSNIGLVYGNRGQRDIALKYYRKAKKIMDNLGLQNTGGYATMIINIGAVYHARGQLDRALEYYGKAKKVMDYLALQNIRVYATLMSNIGLVYDNRGQRDIALKYYRKAKKIMDNLGLQNTGDYATLMNNIRNLY